MMTKEMTAALSEEGWVPGSTTHHHARHREG
jgi:hypothetical protein